MTTNNPFSWHIASTWFAIICIYGSVILSTIIPAIKVNQVGNRLKLLISRIVAYRTHTEDDDYEV